MNDALWALFLIGLGLVLAWHCPGAAYREWRSGIGYGRHGSYRREHDPLRFWGTVLMTVTAGIMGLAFAALGLIALFRPDLHIIR